MMLFCMSRGHVSLSISDVCCKRSLDESQMYFAHRMIRRSLAYSRIRKKICIEKGCLYMYKHGVFVCAAQGSHSHGNSGKVMEKFVVMESHGKVMENNKTIKSHGKVKFHPNSSSKCSPRYRSFKNCPVMNFS